MHLSRLVVTTALGALAALGAATRLHGQTPAPRLTKPQQAVLHAVVTAADMAAANPTTVVPSQWQVHVMRASDGSHYVALRGRAPGLIAPKAPVMLYVRLAHRVAVSTSTPARSAVREWLDGERAEPMPMRVGRAMAIPMGEMPVGGAAASVGRRADGTLVDQAVESTVALRLMDMERQRANREREEREAKRRAELELAAKTTSSLHPFEDFDVAATLEADGSGTAVLRSVRAGPGDYTLTVAWAEPAAATAPPTVRVLTHRLQLPTAAKAFAVSDIVLADQVRTLPGAYSIDQQNAHPYAIGAIEVSPAADAVFRVDERLSVVFQVVDPAGDAAGKPDVEVGFKISRIASGREEPVGTLPAQRYHAATLPADFDVAKGHPVFPAVQASLARFVRGQYRLEVTAIDRLAGVSATRDTRFEVVGTPHSLLNEAPAPGQAFRRDAVLAPPMLGVLARALTPAAPSDGLTRLLGAATGGRFADLLREAPIVPAERPVAQALRGLGLYALGDSARAVAVQLQQALAQGAPPAPVFILLGASSALAGDDKAAVTMWNQARDAGIDDVSVAALLIDAYMRQGDVARATAMARAALDAQPGTAAAARGLAAARIAAGQYADALAVLDGLTTATPDPDTDFLVVHALYGGLVGDTAPGNTATGRDRLRAVGQRYIDAGGRHAALVKEWLAVAAATSP
ncbi:MAG: tetratricopeptide repeat protein [Vicinamibacterales bacterium]